jgi:peptidoglycan/xylan/chitin deacetylase (PgdA/CDA1 family)
MIQPIRTAKAAVSGFISKGAALAPIHWVRPLSGVSLVVPYYHMVSDTDVRHIRHLYRFRTVAEFRSDVEFFLRGFEPVTLSDMVDAVAGRRELKRPCFHLTFDDGFTEMHDVVAPILHRAGVPATFFLNTAFLDGGGLAHHNVLSLLIDRLQALPSHTRGASLQKVENLLPPAKDHRNTLISRILELRYGQRPLVRALAEALEVDLEQYVREVQPYLSGEQVQRMLNQGFSMGAHSHDHPLYGDLPLAEQLSQTRTSVNLLQDRFGLAPKAFAFPHTDSGVEPEFFNTIYSESLVDISFGTGGLVSHFHPRNIERVGMEKTSAPAAQILARQFTRATYLRAQTTFSGAGTQKSAVSVASLVR